VPLVAVQQLAQPWLLDRNLAVLQTLDLGGHLVDANNVVAALGQTGALNQTNISRSNDCDFHDVALSLVRFQNSLQEDRLIRAPPRFPRPARLWTSRYGFPML